jgi:hypothetical protein
MIIGLDHLSLNCKDNISFKKKIIYYQKIFGFRSINHKEKDLFINKTTRNHYISFHTILANLPPIEKTYYGKSKFKAQNIKVKKNNVFLSVFSKKKEFAFWKKVLNLQASKNKINFFSFYDQKKYKFYFDEKYKSKDYLDYIGYTSLCFVSTDIFKVYKSCKGFNIEISNIFNFKMNKKKIKIFFFRSPGGIIFEIVQYIL